MNWTGAPSDREPLGIRAMPRCWLWRYRIVELTHACFTFRDVEDGRPCWSNDLDGPNDERPAFDGPVRIDSVFAGTHSWFTFWNETYENGLTAIAADRLTRHERNAA